jgi:hypothetical protein
VNGDGLPDLLASRPGTRLVYLNNGIVGWTSAPSSWDIPFDFVRRDPTTPPSSIQVDNGVRITDVNGDGLADVLRAYHDYRVADEEQSPVVCLNHGGGWDPPGGWMLPGGDTVSNPKDDLLFGAFTNTAGKVYRDFGVQILDVDGDRYADIVARANATTAFEGKVYLSNHANGWIETGWQVPVPMVWESLTKLGQMQVGDIDNGVRVTDANGDGLPDLVFALKKDNDLEPPVTFLGRGPHSDLLVQNMNLLSGLTTITYTSASGLGLPAGQKMPSVRSVVDTLTLETGLGDPAVSRKFQFGAGLSGPLLDPATGRPNLEFRGFGKVTETHADGSKQERTYYQGEGTKGFLLSEFLRGADGTIYLSKYQDYSSEENPNLKGQFKTLLKKDRVVRHHQDRQSDQKERVRDYLNYDDYGNPKDVEVGYEGTVARRTTPSSSIGRNGYSTSFPPRSRSSRAQPSRS